MTSQQAAMNGNRYVTPDGEMPRVTSILSAAVAKPGLIPWAAKVEREMIVGIAEAQGVRVPQLPKTYRHAQISRESLDIGSEAHKIIEQRLHAFSGRVVNDLVEPSTQESRAAVAAFDQWFADRVDVKVRAVEFMVWSKAHRYAGTLDTLVEDGVLEVWDFKTSSMIDAGAYMQVSSYAQAVDEMGHGPVRRARIVQLPKYPGKVKEYVLDEGEIEAAWRGFKAAQGVNEYLEHRKGAA